jgi:teichoic acid transport system ATP-binding protein
MNSDYVVEASNMCKCYKIYNNTREKLLDIIINKRNKELFYALKGIDFKVKKGDVVGLLGLNGSGKSTLSNILGGISVPSSGSITVNGEPALVAISSGFNNQLTGIENIELKGLLLGFSKEKIKAITREVIEFSELGEFIYQPVKTYSSGMKSRLGFAISININPDILVIDEALSVGDATFTEKCLSKMNKFKEDGKTIFFVSHSLSQIKSFCNKALWLENGGLREYGDVDTVVSNYERFIREFNQLNEEEKKEYKKKGLSSQKKLFK